MSPLSLVFGASGGIGRALLDGLRERAEPTEIVALSRQAPPNWCGHHVSFDLADEASIAEAVEAACQLGMPTTVIVATGLLHAGAIQPEKSYRALSADTLHQLLGVNLIGPALIAKHVLPRLPRKARSVFAVLSARVGSIEDNRAGGWYGYRTSKAGLNMLVKTLAIEHRRTHPGGICVALHPGTVQTSLSAPFAGARETLTPSQSAAALLTVIESLTPDQTGAFLSWDGSSIPW